MAIGIPFSYLYYQFMTRCWIQIKYVPSEADSKHCRTSTLLVFKTPKHEIIDCVLRYYDNATFVEYVEQDRALEGASTIREALNECFSAKNAINHLDMLD